MSSATTRASKYSYRASSGGVADVNIEYSADLTALTRLEVKKLHYSIAKVLLMEIENKLDINRNSHSGWSVRLQVVRFSWMIVHGKFERILVISKSDQFSKQPSEYCSANTCTSIAMTEREIEFFFSRLTKWSKCPSWKFDQKFRSNCYRWIYTHDLYAYGFMWTIKIKMKISEWKIKAKWSEEKIKSENEYMYNVT